MAFVHLTHHNKGKAIQMVGLRVGPGTKSGTGYKRTNGVARDPVRDAAWERSEEFLEKTRPSDIPTRKGAIFFYPKDFSIATQEPDIFKVGEDDLG